MIAHLEKIPSFGITLNQSVYLSANYSNNVHLYIIMLLLIFTGNHQGMERERVKKKPGKAIIISGTSAEPPIHDEPIDMSDTSEYVMEYTGKMASNHDLR